MEYALSIVIGIALSATAGFRVFVPFLVISAANLAGWLELTDSLPDWDLPRPGCLRRSHRCGDPGLLYLLVDNVLNAISVPASLVAGTVLTYAFISDMARPGSGSSRSSPGRRIPPDQGRQQRCPCRFYHNHRRYSQSGAFLFESLGTF